MRSRLAWRRLATAAGLWGSAALAVLATVIAARLLGLDGFGKFATVVAAAGFFQTLLDLTVEEALTKYGFRYLAASEHNRLRRLFRVALYVKLSGGALAAVVLLSLAPFADRLFNADGLLVPFLVCAALPLIQAPENIAATALILRGRYDLRAAVQTFSMGLRLLGVAIGATLGITEAVLGMVSAQILATLAIGAVGVLAFRRVPGQGEEPLGSDRAGIIGFVSRSSLSTGVVSFRGAVTPLLLGAVTGPAQVGLLRVAQAPQTGFNVLSSPVRLILLTEQTREWERGRRAKVLHDIRRYLVWAAVAGGATTPLFWWAMPDLVRLVFGTEYAAATDAARVILLAAAVHLVFGWSKSFPVTIGRPGLRLAAHGIESVVLLPLVVILGQRSGVEGAAWAVLISSVVYAAIWLVFLSRIVSAESERNRHHPELQETS